MFWLRNKKIFCFAITCVESCQNLVFRHNLEDSHPKIIKYGFGLQLLPILQNILSAWMNIFSIIPENSGFEADSQPQNTELC